MYKIISIILLSSLLFYSNCFAKEKAVKNKPVKTQTKAEKRIEVNVVTVKNTAEFRQALENASANGKDDIIILEAGTYKTTDDNLGTFKFSDTEAHNLTIKAKDGLTANDVILDGANTHQALNLTNTKTATFTFEMVTIRNGKTSPHGDGGGIFTDQNLTVTNSTISGNTASGNGGGIYGYGTVTVTNSTISGNTASLGGGISGSGTFINNIFDNNNSDIYFTGSSSNVYNNYIDYTKLQNESNYTIVKKNNIQPSSGSLNFADSSFRLGAGSAAIDKGLDPNSDAFINLFKDTNTLKIVTDALKTDKDGNRRFTSSGIDLGPYEFDPATYKPPVEKKPISSFDSKEKSSNQDIKDKVNISSNQISMSEKLTAFNTQEIKAEINRGSSIIQNCLDEKMAKKSFKLNSLSEYTKCADEAIKENGSNGSINNAFILGIYVRVWGNLVIADKYLRDKHSKWDNPSKANETIKTFLKDIRKKQQQFKLTDKILCEILDVKFEKLKPFFERW